MRKTQLILLIHFLLNVFLFGLGNLVQNGYLENMDLLQPYSGHHGPKYRTNREAIKCQDIKYGNLTHSSIECHGFQQDLKLPIVKSKHMIHAVKANYFETRDVNMHHAVVNNPHSTISVLEPGKSGGCKRGSGDRATVKQSSERRHCLLAVNACFFNTHNGACYGNIVSDNHLVQDSGGIQNAHFGITNSGKIFIGYLSEIDLVAMDFKQLVGGVIWLIRDGKSYIQESLKVECSDSEETGTLKQFVEVMSSRTAIGYDKEGKVVIMQADGKTGHNGLTLYEFVDILLDYGVVSAINFDGGGSSTYVINGTLVNYPSDQCENDTKYNCAREVSTIVCVHEPDCSPPDCSQHGTCVTGKCKCTGYWSGTACNQLKCPNDCSGHGTCFSEGCICNAGFMGSSCNTTCPIGHYGSNCVQLCMCLNGGSCEVVNGTCHCPAGYTGTLCENVCPYGVYGVNCSRKCECHDQCFCNHVTGNCNSTNQDFYPHQGLNCHSVFAGTEYEGQLNLNSKYRGLIITAICVCVVGAFSMLLNVVLGYKMYSKTRHRKSKKRAVLAESQQLYKFLTSTTSSEDEWSSFNDYPMKETSFQSRHQKKNKRTTRPK